MSGGTRRWTRRLLGIACLVPLAACYEHTVTVGGGAPAAPVVYDHWQQFWLAGLIGHTQVDVQEMCPSGRATIVAKQTFLNGLVSALTSGIYTPTTLRVRCWSGGEVALDLTSEDVARIVTDDRFVAWVAAELPARRDEAMVARAELPTP